MTRLFQLHLFVFAFAMGTFSSLLVVSPGNGTAIPYGNAGRKFNVKFDQSINSNSVVHINAPPGIIIDKCLLTFSPSNYGQSQEFQAYLANGDVQNDQNLILEFYIDNQMLPDTTVSVTTGSKNFEQCQSAGDPHFSTFDKREYSYMNAGWHYLAYTDEYAVQVEHITCGNAACNGRVAVQYKTSIVILDFDSSGKSCNIVKRGSQEIVATEVHKDSKYTFHFGAVTIAVDVFSYVGFLTSNVYVQDEEHKAKCYDGLCGNFDGDAGNDAHKYDSLSVYKVSDDQMLYTCGNNCTDHPKPKCDLIAAVCTYKPTFQSFTSSSSATSTSATVLGESTAISTSTTMTSSTNTASQSPVSSSTPQFYRTTSTTSATSTSYSTEGTSSDSSSSPHSSTSSYTTAPTSPTLSPSSPSSSTSLTTAPTSPASSPSSPSSSTSLTTAPTSPASSPSSSSSGSSPTPTTSPGFYSSTVSSSSTLSTFSSISSSSSASESTPVISSTSPVSSTPITTSSSLTVIPYSTSTSPSPSPSPSPVPYSYKLQVPDNLNPSPDTAFGQAKQYCTDAFSGLECGTINIDFFVNSCIIDATALGSVTDIIKNYVNSYLTKCRIYVGGLQLSGDKSKYQTAVNLQKVYGFSPAPIQVSPIPSKATNYTPLYSNITASPSVNALTCKNNGIALAYGGCQCTPEFTGVDCSVSLNDCKTIEPTLMEIKSILGLGSQNSTYVDSAASKHSSQFQVYIALIVTPLFFIF